MHAGFRLLAALGISTALAACSGSTSGSLPGAQRDALSRPAPAHAEAPSLNGVVDGHPMHVLLPRNGAKGSSVGNLVYHGGPIQKNPVVYVVYWGFTGSAADPDGVAPYLTAFLQGVGGSSILES
ncbi:hypothetical protein WPS_23960 [Vulcanimicrobium alpinum]|uniref:Uncharacterized protein n=1 Tax=Vulcanimicrobium alpinum TaxID=3016050 RepID=A0AAN1XY81_UNVUL|nr:hypothetical protein [Vulcanimicrobium alpinum]BDE07120.1 hypothetical protein WPS_23960 [Vulcanimicrobium alpinum]